MREKWIIAVLEYHLDQNQVSETARVGCQFHGEYVLIRAAAGWHRTDDEPRPGGGFLPSNAAIGEVSARAVKDLKSSSANERLPGEAPGL